tara:strand:+ start:218195 stop:219166 length:972 start_codon:yes stop_codon:yes gene_type:complete
MTSARSMQINLEATPYYHCTARCVRHSYLCGFNKKTKQDYSHRKQWLVNKIKELSNIFSIKICAYAIMSNHYHLVLFVDQPAALNWSDDEVQSRWAEIFPTDAKSNYNKSDKIMLWRTRLYDISWFMKCLNEYLARASNLEDKVTGKFWESRFKSQALLDDAALLNTMAYVDLNPIRAGMAQTPEESEFTSIYERIKSSTKQAHKKNKDGVNITQPNSLAPFASKELTSESSAPSIDYSLNNYFELVDYTGRILRNDKFGSIPKVLEPILQRIHLCPNTWIDMIKRHRNKFFHAIGGEGCLINFSKNRARNAKGIQAARILYS